MKHKFSRRPGRDKFNTVFVKKPWGSETWFAQTNKYVGKILSIKKGHRLSLQYHRKKHETLYLYSGSITLTLKKRKIAMKPGDSFIIPPGTVHRMEARNKDAVILEVSTPEITDVVRIEDDYKR